MFKNLMRIIATIIIVAMTTTILYSRTYANSETSTEVNPTKRYYLKDEQGNDIADKWFEYKFTRDKLAKEDGVPYTDGSVGNTAIAITAFSENFGDTLMIPDGLTKSHLRYLYLSDIGKR